MLKIRVANLKDIQTMRDIYGYYILNTAISFECKIPTIEEFKSRFEKGIKNHPWYVCEEGQKVIGFCYGSFHNERAAYLWAANCSIYLDKEYIGRGVGRGLYSTLFETLIKQNVCTVHAGITLPNDASVRIHERFGLEKIGVYKNVGFKFDQWHDVGWWQKSFVNFVKHTRPNEFIPFHRLELR